MSIDERDLTARLHEAFDGLTLEVPAAQITRVGRRRRSLGVAAGALATILAVALIAGVGRGEGLTVAGFAVQDVAGTSAIVFVEPSTSMEPTIEAGQVVAVDVGAYANASPARGDIVAFRHDDPSCDPSLVYLKRVIGLPGDVVAEEDGILSVNGAPLDAPTERRGTTLGPWTVEPGHLFVVGDHLANSNDSRFGLGQISFDDVVGRVDLSLDVSGANVSPPVACAVSVVGSS